jgi:tyrosine-protein phosphatase YwqE
MFSIFKKKYPARPVDLSFLQTDMHSHLLPGIDDGATDLANSLELKKGLEDLGYRQFITTPHIMWDMYKNTADSIGSTLRHLQQEPGQQNIRAGAEYFMDDHFDQLVDSNQPLLTLSGKKVLVEFSFVSPPLSLKEKLFNLQIKGYQPVLAHPERYAFYAANKTVYEELRTIGCLFQINLLSLAGYYGKPSLDLAHYLIGRKYVDFLGSDLHHTRHLECLRSSKQLMPVLQPLFDSGLLQNPAL